MIHDASCYIGTTRLSVVVVVGPVGVWLVVVGRVGGRVVVGLLVGCRLGGVGLLVCWVVAVCYSLRYVWCGIRVRTTLRGFYSSRGY